MFLLTLQTAMSCNATENSKGKKLQGSKVKKIDEIKSGKHMGGTQAPIYQLQLLLPNQLQN